MADIVKLECHIGMASRTVDVPAGFSGTPEFLTRHFADGSRGVIALTPVNRVDEPALVGDDAREVDALDLHRCAATLTRNEPGTGPVSRVALVLADRYRFAPGIFGVMFDRGKPTDDDPNSAAKFVSTPREGCAIFLGAIRELRPKLKAYDREVEFTAVHELGHLFNLEHRPSAKNFMETSQVDEPYTSDHFTFLADQKNWLAECATNPAVRPGGSIFDPVAGLNAPGSARIAKNANLSLRIGVARKEFPCASPVELDIGLYVSGTQGTYYVPERLDPGYSQLRLWITHPNGERRLFRSPRRYCGPVRKVSVARGRPQCRDISIFEGADGATFAKPGVYQLEAEFDLGARGRLVSNRLSVRAVANRESLSPQRMALLTDARVRRFLYHRSVKVGSGRAVVGALVKHLGDVPGGRGADDIRYALIRALARYDAPPTKARRQLLRELLARVFDGKVELGDRQLHHLSEIHAQVGG